jgi:hypothetical protein
MSNMEWKLESYESGDQLYTLDFPHYRLEIKYVDYNGEYYVDMYDPDYGSTGKYLGSFSNLEQAKKTLKILYDHDSTNIRRNKE